MYTCSTCGKELKGQDKFCKSCGTSKAGSNQSLNDKKARIMGRDKTWIKPVVIAGAIVLVLVAVWAAKGLYMKKKMGNRPMFSALRDPSARLSKAVAVTSENGDVRIPLATFDDNKAHFFAYTSGNKTITFFAIKAMDGSIRTALDACVSCNHAKLGYRQEGDLVVCNNCGMGFKPTDIGMATGGCNPIAVTKSIDGQTVVLKVKDLEAGAQYF
jgi:uncharacterized membrane protein